MGLRAQADLGDRHYAPSVVFGRVLVAAQLAAGHAAAVDGFDDSMKDLRDSVGPAVRAVGARLPISPNPRSLPQSGARQGHGSENPCLADKALDALRVRWTFEPEPPAFYVKPLPVQVEFSGGRCEPYRPPTEAHHGDTPQAIRAFPGSKDYDLVLVTDAGASLTGVVLITKSGMVAVSYGEFPTESLLAGTVELPRLPVAKSLTVSMKGASRLSLLATKPSSSVAVPGELFEPGLATKPSSSVAVPGELFEPGLPK